MSSETDQTVIMMQESEGDSVTLLSNLTDVQYEDDIVWFYRDVLIAGHLENTTKYNDCHDGRFNKRLQLDDKTGSLTITNISKIHSGIYKLLITKEDHQECHSHNVTVYSEFKYT